MSPWFAGRFGNASGSHHVARAARAALEDSRDRIAAWMGTPPAGVVFTSGGTESDNLAVLGPLGNRPGAVVVSAVEHPAVLEAARASGREVRIAAVSGDGRVDPDGLRQILDADVAVVSIQLVNHETGVIQPLDAIARRVRRWAPRALLHTDAVQAAPWFDLAAGTAAADLVSVSSHKIGGPQGVGALAVRGGVELSPLMRGGGQEAERRSGTHNVAGAVGFAAAATALVGAAGPGSGAWEQVSGRRERLAAGIARAVDGMVRTSPADSVVPGHLHVRFPGVESEALLFMLDEAGVCASAGAACASGAIEPSPVLLAMGVDKGEAGSALRLTLGPATAVDEVDWAAAAVAEAVNALRARVPGS
jgi:cysteine desulfurase